MRSQPTRRVLAGTAAAVLIAMAVPALSAGGARETIQPDYTLVRNAPSSYVLGSALRGWVAHVQQSPVNGYRWGFVYRSIHRCVWTSQAALGPSSGTVSDQCPHSGRLISLRTFSNGRIGRGGHYNHKHRDGTDGLPAHIRTAPSGCTNKKYVDGRGYTSAFANVPPWLQPARPSEFMYGVPDGYSRLLWRYISRDGHWVLVRLRDFKTTGQGLPTWFFVARGCIHLDVYRGRHS